MLGRRTLVIVGRTRRLSVSSKLDKEPVKIETIEDNGPIILKPIIVNKRVNLDESPYVRVWNHFKLDWHFKCNFRERAFQWNSCGNLKIAKCNFRLSNSL